MAHRTGDDDRLGAAAEGVFEDLASEPGHEIGPRDRESRAAAFDLEGPLDGGGADFLQDLVHAAGILGAVEADDFGRPHQKAAVVTGHLAGERDPDPLPDAVDHEPFEEFEDVHHPDASSDLHRDDPGDLLPQLFIIEKLLPREAEAVEAGGAGDDDILHPLFLRRRQNPGRQGQRKLAVQVVGGGGAAAVPVGHFLQFDPHRPGDGQQRFDVFARGSFQGTARVIDRSS